VTLFPAGQARPASSNVNFAAGTNVPNLATVGLGAGGALSIHNAFGATHVALDIVGWYDDGSLVGGLYNALVPSRILDTRSGVGAPRARISAGATVDVQVTGRGGVPTADVGAVVLNVTVDRPTSAGFLTVWPQGQVLPNASNLNFVEGLTVANSVTVPVNPVNGNVSIFNAFGTAEVIADVVGWYDADGLHGARFHSVAPTRVLDTRIDEPMRSGEVRDVGVGGAEVPGSATAIVGNVTVTDASAAAYLTVWPSGASNPSTSVLNWTRGRTVANHLIATRGANGFVSMSYSSGRAAVILDVVGYFAPA
jgi:hypothetical protein